MLSLWSYQAKKQELELLPGIPFCVDWEHVKALAYLHVPHVVSGCCIPRLPSGTTRVCCGPQAILLPHVVGHRYPSFGSTWKTNDKTCERFALSALYLRPQTAELYGTFVDMLPGLKA